jgi:hypothetical protein
MKPSVRATDPKGPSPLLTRIAEGLRELFLPSYLLDIEELLENVGKDKKSMPVTE